MTPPEWGSGGVGSEPLGSTRRPCHLATLDGTVRKVFPAKARGNPCRSKRLGRPRAANSRGLTRLLPLYHQPWVQHPPITRAPEGDEVPSEMLGIRGAMWRPRTGSSSTRLASTRRCAPRHRGSRGPRAHRARTSTLSRGLLIQAQVAKHVGTSERALQRRLTTEGTSFSCAARTGSSWVSVVRGSRRSVRARPAARRTASGANGTYSRE
jgi:hypothetical protein